MKKNLLGINIFTIAVLCIFTLPVSAAIISYPLDLSDLWNVDGFYTSDDDTFIDGAFGLDNGNARIRSWTLPEDFVDGEPNLTEDGELEFLLGPTSQPGELDAYRPVGDTIDVPEKIAYDRVYMALMSGNGNFPGTDWEGQDIFTVNYTDGSSEEIAIGLVNDWFWNPPEWVAPESGDPSEIVVDLLCHDSDPDEFDHLWGWAGLDPASHDYGQYRLADGEEGFITYQLPYEEGATLWLEMWGNIKVEYRVDGDFDPFNPDVEFDGVLYDQSDIEVYPGGGDGYQPNRDKYDFDLSNVITGSPDNIYLRFTDAAPGEAADGGNWGARIHRIGMFTGPVEMTRLGERLWGGLVRTDGNSPDGGLILIKKAYRLDNTKEVDSITMPTLLPDDDPLLTVFGITLGVIDETSVSQFMIY